MKKEFNVKDYEGKVLKSKKCEHNYRLITSGTISYSFFCTKCLDIKEIRKR